MSATPMSGTSQTKPMSGTSHTKAAEAHEATAKMERMAAEHHQKGDHKAGLEHAEKALASSQSAHEATKGAHGESKTAVR